MTSLLTPRPPPLLRLLADYPEPQRTQLLDYLFKAGYGAALQTLKLEVGGDTNSADGAEPGHLHTRDTVDCGQGYQWWIAEQAKAPTGAKNWWWGNGTLRLGGPNGKCVDVEKETPGTARRSTCGTATAGRISHGRRRPTAGSKAFSPGAASMSPASTRPTARNW